MWLNTTVQVSQIGLITTTYLTYAFGSKLDWLATNPLALASTSVLLILGMMTIARLGLGIGKWLSNAGSFFTVLILVVLAVIPFFRAARATPYAYHPLPLIHPPLTLFTFSVFSKMTFGALTGFELVAIFAGESRNPARNLARSILFTAPLIALLYILGTSSILAYVSPDSIDVIGPIPQALSLALSGFAFARFLVPVVILLLLTNYLSSYTLYFSTNTRLPLVAGWDQLLPRQRRSRKSGSFRLTANLELDFLWPGVSRHVRDSTLWKKNARGRKNFRSGTFKSKRFECRNNSPRRMAAPSRLVRISHHAAVRRALDLPHRRRNQPLRLFAEDRPGRAGSKSDRLAHLPRRSANQPSRVILCALCGLCGEKILPYLTHTLPTSSTRTLDFFRAPVFTSYTTSK